MSFSPLLTQLIEALRFLPGVGPRSAQRMAFDILENHREKALQLADAMTEAVEKVGHCSRCRTLSETEICDLCQDAKRNESLLCIVETPADIVAIEQSGAHRGYYFVLMGHLSPLDGIGPEELGMDQLLKRLQDEALEEIIVATNHTVEGEATAHYISEMAKPFNLKVSRIAHGVPLGGELTHVDSSTLAEALLRRNSIDS